MLGWQDILQLHRELSQFERDALEDALDLRALSSPARLCCARLRRAEALQRVHGWHTVPQQRFMLSITGRETVPDTNRHCPAEGEHVLRTAGPIQRVLGWHDISVIACAYI